MKAVVVHKYGSPEVLSYGDVKNPEPKANESLVKTESIGVNYIDIYHRTGFYPNELPFIPGMEAAGVVEESIEFKEGERVAYAMTLGSYAEYVAVPSWKLVEIPDDIDSQTAASVMLQGMTAHYLVHDTYPLKEGNTVLVHAAAGGVGRLLVQIAKLLGATIFGTVSTGEKARIAKDAGADHVIIYTKADFEEEVMKFTNNRGVDVVYDSVGRTTFEKSLNCLKTLGCMVLFGQSSGTITNFDLNILSKKGLFITRPSLHHHASSREEILKRANKLFQWITSGEIKTRIHKTFPLEKASDAHELLESRQTSGKLLLIP